MISITKIFLPSLEDYQLQVKRAFDNEWLTNRGELVLELEDKLTEYLNINNIIAMNNGTIPLQIALKVIGNQGEIITTPFSYVATTSAIVWENCTPVFVDIHPKYLTIDETKIEQAITEKTTAILATHVFGNPCNVDVIRKIAKKYGISVIYDAAHAFGVTYKEKSLFNFGDISTCSFHATKLFHTGEGGAIFSNDKELFKKLFYSHNFGHKNRLEFHGLGVNGKMSELQAAMGLAVLPSIDIIIKERKKIVEYYNENLDFTIIQKITIRKYTKWNYCYYPTIFETEATLLKVEQQLNKENIFPRRYFYPSLNTLNYVAKVSKPISESISSRVLCLPLYVGLEKENQIRIINIINNLLK